MSELTNERVEEILESEKQNWPIGDGKVTAWISFAGEDGFLGVVILPLSEDVPGPMHAILATRYAGINPGGSVRITVYDSESFPENTPTARLLQKHELIELGLVQEDA